MSDVFWQVTVGAIVTIVLAYMSHRNSKKLNAIAATGEKTHTLVNSGWGVQLKLGADLSRWKADREPTPENVKAAELAEKTLLDHDAKQAVVDAGPQ